MAAPVNILPANVPIVTGPRGLMEPTWYRYFVGQNRNTSAAASGEVTTAVGSGLSGGGFVADGVNLEIAPNGVTNGMIRQSLATSVIGRMAGSAGNVADIQATADNRVFGRFGGQLVFLDLTTAISSVPFASYAVADLPSASPAGKLAYATNARNAGEGAGVGTGSLVVSSGSIWRIPGIATAVAA